MAFFKLTTHINAPVERCFDLSLSVDLHTLSTKATNETAIAGVTSGIMKYNDTVTWRAKHLGVYQELTTKITVYDRPKYFVSEMQKGTFKRLYHQHIFEVKDGITIMTDLFEFEAPFGILGKFACWLFLADYMKKFLVLRNDTIKRVAESDEWKQLLSK